MIKKILIGIGVVLLLLIGVVALILWRLDPEELGQEVIRRVNEKGGMQLEAQTFSIKPFQGIFIEQARLTGDGPSGRIDAEVAEVIVEYELLPILKKKLVIDRIIIREPRAELVSSPAAGAGESAAKGSSGQQKTAGEAAPAESPSAEEGGFKPSVAIDEVRIENASLTFRTEGQEADDLVIRGLELELDDFYVDPAAIEPLIGLTARGQILIERVETGDMTIEGGRGRIEMAEGAVAIRDMDVETSNASLGVAAFDLDLGQEPPTYHLEAGGAFDLNSFVDAEGEGGFGPAALSLTIDGVSVDPEAATGSGDLRMEAGTIPAFPVVAKIERLLGEPLITGTPYKVTDINFTLADGIVTVLPFRLEMENLQIGVAGTSEIAGDLNLGVDVRLRRELVDIDMLDPLIDGMTDEEGWTVVPFEVTGPSADPDVDLDMSAAKDYAKDAAKDALDDVMDSAIESAEKGLRKLLKRDKDDDGG